MKIFKACMLFLLIFSCSPDDGLLDDPNNDDSQFENPVNIPKYSATELIIQFKENVPPAIKQALRTNYGVISYETCHCTDETIEKWTFEDGINIEERKQSISTSTQGGVESIKNVDHEFSFEREKTDADTGMLSNTINYESVISPDNHGVTIAVLDTGLDVNYPDFVGQYLYNTNNCECETNTGIPSQVSGWDYVNEDDDTHDDHPNIHGTKVAFIMHKQMIADNIPHQILPLKVADHFGKISAFNLICGTKNAVQFANIVNMSLGYYSNGEDDKSKILEDIIINNNYVLFVTSAGNSDRDTEDFVHYPSSYAQENVVAIAAANDNGIEKAYFSNYGVLSIDFYAIGEDVPFTNYPTGVVDSISGTSYATPHVSAIAAKLLYNSGMALSPDLIIQELDIIGVPIPNDGYKVKYRKIIN